MEAIRIPIITMMLMRLGMTMTGVDNAAFVHKHAVNKVVSNMIPLCPYIAPDVCMTNSKRRPDKRGMH